VRLQRYLAASGIASRRRSEELIAGGLVRVNGRVVRELGTSVAEGDVVEYGGRIVAPAAERTYLVMNKPLGVVTTMRDPEGRRTVADLLRRGAVTQRVVPVGRLDYDTAGVLLLTDDGELAHVLMHPRFGVEKTYRATLRGRLDPRETAALREGVRLAEGRAEGALLRVIAVRQDSSVVDVTVHEGRNRQVRRMFEAVGHPVVDLVRMRFGPIGIGSLGPGELRPVTDRELAALHALASEAQTAPEPD
jgi:23S rRNA pseudouridine2605 synthase